MPSTEDFYRVKVINNDDTSVWPKLTAQLPNQLNLENGSFKLEADRKVLFGGNGQISAVGDLSFLAGETNPQLKIFANGNIGIGTDATVPTNKLEVVGKIKANELEASSSLKLQGDVTVNKFSNDETLKDNNDQAIPTEKAVKTYVDSKVAAIPSSQWSKSGANLVYNVPNSNVGIGTSQPSAQLEVAGNFKLLTGVAVDQFSNDTKLGDDDQAVPTQKAVKAYVDGRVGAISSSQWSKSGANLIYNIPNSNVGIGTNNPTALLELQQTPKRDWIFLRQENGAQAGGGFYIYNPCDDEDKKRFAFKNQLQIGYQSDTPETQRNTHFVIDGITGNVGIGTDSANSKLTVEGVVDASGGFFQNGDHWKINDENLDVDTISGDRIRSETITKKQLHNSVFQDITGSKWSTFANTNNIYYNDGNVGIGTTTPKSLLEIRKDISGQLGPVLTLQNGSGSAGAGAAIDFNGYDVGQNDPHARIQSLDDGSHSSHVAFYTKEPGTTTKKLQERLRIQSTGNVGIGTSQPSAKLEVAGNLMLGKGIAVDEFVSDLGSVEGDGNTSVPTVAAVKQFVQKLSEQFKTEINSLQQQKQRLTDDLQNIKNELNELKNQMNQVRPPSVIAINSRNQWIALKAGNYDGNKLRTMGLDKPKGLLIPPAFTVLTYNSSNFEGGATFPTGGNPTREWGHYNTWGNFLSIKIQAA
jgi:hypothetical protein